ncbi:3-methyl-2-oxobutanoate hydroxymethyltransferase [Porticoccaceae bacterium]|jgi:3-methyl-2-oxobutanoate hydroxymethyltransferase|nr:3-methyl-2-oxobutanoate hydroxymethyltransferase [Porticoccaceae bacterium]CAI8290218.1 MAG: 3-methyl-2-oxobutanoate hydroxymethyltransferase [SAR92 bacterium MED-G29]|tara:strand:+ start:30535 stop:31326 length:792 start_codon:yes stop_codon:yes gene_type:complete
MKTTTITNLNAMKADGEKFAVITAYDYTFSRLIETAGIEVTLVGDSLGNVIQGRDSTIPVTVDEMAYHTEIVKRGNSRTLLMTDMPFMSYATENQALDNAAILMQAGAQMVKLEGGEWLAETIYMLTERGIPVCGHVGLTPQSVHKLGGYKVQGKDEEAAQQMIDEAAILEEAGADLLVVECVPSSLGRDLSAALTIPVIGIGAGPDTDAQVLVLQDMLGISQRLPKFSKNFLEKTDSIQDAIIAYGNDVRSGAFPAPEHCFK